VPRCLAEGQHDLERLVLSSVAVPQSFQLLHVVRTASSQAYAVPTQPSHSRAARHRVRRHTKSAPGVSDGVRASARAPGSSGHSTTPSRPATTRTTPGSSRPTACPGWRTLGPSRRTPHVSSPLRRP
jgi:hypothetical protein